MMLDATCQYCVYRIEVGVTYGRKYNTNGIQFSNEAVSQRPQHKAKYQINNIKFLLH
jgi:hypothetical protein